MFWYGIGLKIFLILLCTFIAVMAVLYLILGEVPLPGLNAKT
jgi:preprotein translocase subunit SecY